MNRNSTVVGRIDATVNCVEIYQILEIGFNVVLNRIKRHIRVKKLRKVGNCIRESVRGDGAYLTARC